MIACHAGRFNSDRYHLIRPNPQEEITKAGQAVATVLVGRLVLLGLDVPVQLVLASPMLPTAVS